MGYHLEKIEKSYADSGTLLAWGNAVACVACLADYFLFDRPWALETLALLCLIFNGGFILARHQQLKTARRLDTRDEAEKAAWEADYDRRQREKGWR